MEMEPTEPGGFVLEGVRGDYSGSMSVFVCAGMFRRLAAMVPPAKAPLHLTPQKGSRLPALEGLEPSGSAGSIRSKVTPPQLPESMN